MQVEQEMVRRQAEILQMIFESLPMGVMVADLEGRLLPNPAAQRILDPGTGVPITPERTTSLWQVP
jgi:PAS domain-containing protein